MESDNNNNNDLLYIIEENHIKGAALEILANFCFFYLRIIFANGMEFDLANL